jgi:hypothetical protein
MKKQTWGALQSTFPGKHSALSSYFAVRFSRALASLIHSNIVSSLLCLYYFDICCHYVTVFMLWSHMTVLPLYAMNQICSWNDENCLRSCARLWQKWTLSGCFVPVSLNFLSVSCGKFCMTW